MPLCSFYLALCTHIHIAHVGLHTFKLHCARRPTHISTSHTNLHPSALLTPTYTHLHCAHRPIHICVVYIFDQVHLSHCAQYTKNQIICSCYILERVCKILNECDNSYIIHIPLLIALYSVIVFVADLPMFGRIIMDLYNCRFFVAQLFLVNCTHVKIGGYLFISVDIRSEDQRKIFEHFCSSVSQANSISPRRVSV